MIVSLCLLLLGFTREIVGAFAGGDGGDTTRRLTIVVAVATIYAMDFAINASESCLLDRLAVSGRFTDRWTLSIYSHVVFKEPDC